jgi:hypothetical protein
MKSLNEFSLIAPCGMNCRICRAYLRDKNKCPGCRAPDADKPVTRVKCKIKTCENLQSRRAKYCFGCVSLPCEILKRLDKRYRTKYNMSMVENLEFIKNFGIRKFIRNEESRWTCPHCGGVICVHKAQCLSCEKKRQKKETYSTLSF